MDPGEWGAIVTGVLGLSGLIWTGLKFNRDDTTKVVDQQSAILRDMHTLNDELRVTADGLRSERDALAAEVGRLREEVRALRG